MHMYYAYVMWHVCCGLRHACDAWQHVLHGLTSCLAHHLQRLLRCSLAGQLSGSATLFDVRRRTSYDAQKLVDQLLDAAETKAWLRANAQVTCRFSVKQAKLIWSLCQQLVMSWWIGYRA